MAVWGALIGGAINYAMRPSGQDVSSMADPWAANRPIYMEQLNRLMTQGFNPNDPAYKARMQAGTSAIERSAAAKGMLGSGNTLAELTQFGQGLASQEYQNQFARLAELAGVQAGSPVDAARLMAGQQQAAAGGAGVLGSQLFGALKNLFNAPSTPQDTTATPATSPTAGTSPYAGGNIYDPNNPSGYFGAPTTAYKF